MRWLTILLLCVPMWAQLATQEKTPLIRQSRMGSNAATAAFLNNVVSGDLLVTWYECFAGSNCTTGPSIADTLGSTWTQRATSQGGACGALWTWTAAANGSGADTVTITNGGSFQNTIIAEFTNVTNTLDKASAVGGTGTTGTITTPSITTTTNGALLLPAMNGCANSQIGSPPPLFPIASPDLSDSMSAAWRVAGAAGSYSASFNYPAAATTVNTSIIAMKAAAALQVVTLAIPDAVKGIAYSFQLNANSGSGSYTWTQLTGSLPPGLSLSGGGVISGTPTASSVSPNMTFRVTDGAAATADSGTLTLHVGTSFSTPALVQAHASTACSVFSLGTVTAGNLLLITYANVIGNYTQVVFTDSQGTVFASLPVGNQVQSSAIGTQTQDMRYAWGFAGGSGADALSCSGSTTAGSSYNVLEFSNIQSVFDPAAQVNTLGSSASPITSGNMTAPVAGLLYAAAQPFTSSATMGASAPYTVGTISTGGAANTLNITEYNASGAAGSNTASFTQSGNTDGTWGISLFGLRPASSGTAPTATTHPRSQIY